VLQHVRKLICYVNSITESDFDGSKNYQIEYWQYYRTRLKQGMVYRGIGNLTLNSIQLWWITLSTADKSLNPSEKYQLIAQKVQNLLKAWRRRHNICHYVIVLSGGDNGENPHYHMVSTAPLDGWHDSEIDSDCRLIGNASSDVQAIARYVEDNLRQNLPFKAQSLRKSSEFKAWSNPLIYHLFRDSVVPVSVYVHNSDISPFNQAEIPPLKACRLCGEKLPHTINYFNHYDKTRGMLRNECYLCFSVMRRIADMNRRAKQSSWRGGGNLPYADVLQLVRDSMVGSQYRDYWTKELIDSYELDHINPLSRGGYHAIGNLCVTSARINRLKADKPLKVWLRELYAMGYYHFDMHMINTAELTRQKRMWDTA